MNTNLGEWIQSRKYPVIIELKDGYSGLRITMTDIKTGLKRNGLISYEILDDFDMFIERMYEELIQKVLEGMIKL